MPHSRAEDAQVAARRAQLVEYRLQGRSYDDIYEELGYKSASAARKDFSRTLAENIARRDTNIEMYREIEVLRLDRELERLTRLYERVEKILDEQHITVSNGRVVLHDGETVPDWGPVFAGVDRLVRIEDARRKVAERRAKLLGLDAPQRMEVLTIDAINAEIQRISDGLGMPSPFGAGEA